MLRPLDDVTCPVNMLPLCIQKNPTPDETDDPHVKVTVEPTAARVLLGWVAIPTSL